MITKTIFKPAKAPAAIGPYNHAVRVGDLLFCAGQIPIDPADGCLVTGDVKAQTERVLQNVKAILDDQELTFANVVKSTVFSHQPRGLRSNERRLRKALHRGLSGALRSPSVRPAQRCKSGN